MLNLIAISTFLAIFCFIIAIHLLTTKTRTLISKRLETYTDKNTFTAILEKHNVKKPLSLLARISKVFKSRSLAQQLETELAQADLPLKGEEFITITIISTLVPAALALLATQNILVAILLAAVGFLFPNIMMKLSQAKRLNQFNNQLTDALVMMANSLRAGFSFFQAMELVSNEMPAPIGQEFKRVLREMNLGTPTEEALENLGKRVKSEDLEMVITAVLIQRQVGGNLAEVLDKISHTIRERVRINGEVRTLTAQGRISGLIIGALPLALLGVLSVINPSYAGLLFTHSIGIILLIGGIVSQIIGILLIQKIVNIKV